MTEEERLATVAGGLLMVAIGAGLLLRLVLHSDAHYHPHGHRAPGHGLTFASAVPALGGIRTYLVLLPLALQGSIADRF